MLLILNLYLVLPLTMLLFNVVLQTAPDCFHWGEYITVTVHYKIKHIYMFFFFFYFELWHMDHFSVFQLFHNQSKLN